ncbi:hypothetical protein, partial [Rhizobium ruizarguesonis]|uniref:hypothetical protein n=1 Tax=Rhizobium ruizarguesonis TaxID=2081791 RepID=UPI0019542C0D
MRRPIAYPNTIEVAIIEHAQITENIHPPETADASTGDNSVTSFDHISPFTVFSIPTADGCLRPGLLRVNQDPQHHCHWPGSKN